MLPQFSKTPRKKGWTHHSFTEEILLQRALATSVVLQCDIPICAESSGEHSDVAKHRFSTANVCVRWEFNKSDKTYKGLSGMLDILYSKFCAATALVVKHNVKKRGICTKLNWRRTESIPELLPVFAFQGNDFTASTADIGIEIERLPEMINRARARHRTDVQEDANDRLKNGPKCVEEPAVRIDIFLLFLLQAKDDLHGNNTLLRPFDLV